MIKTYEITYKGEAVSLNHYKSKNWRALKKLIDPLKNTFTILIIQAKIKPLKWFELEVRHNTRLDLDNVTGSIKPFVDCLRKQKVIKDDTYKEWDKLTILSDKTLPKKTIIFKITGEVKKPT